MFDVNKLRADFPILNKSLDGKPLVYFDNACMSLRPNLVIEAMTRYYTDWSACAGRSNHRLAKRVTDEVDISREKIKKFINAKNTAEIIFTRNTTEGLNLAANCLNLSEGDEVLTSGREHNSNLVPWLKLVKNRGIKHTVVKQNPDNTWDMTDYENKLNSKVKLVSVVQTSNVDGVTFPIKEIAKRAHRLGAKVMVDGAQSVPHQKVDVKDLGVDLLAFSGHKMMGPSGIGVLYGKAELLEKMDGFLVGGDTVEYSTYTDYKHLPLPEKYEAGLQNYAGMIGMGAAVDYLGNLGWKNIQEHELKLNQIITEGIKNLRGLKILGPEDPALRGGIVSFVVKEVDPHQIALMLDESSRIMVRSGQHCVHSWFNAQHLSGSVRASLYVYNTEQEAEFFVEQLHKILTVL